MPITDSFDTTFSPQADPTNIDAIAEHFIRAFPENEDIQERVKMAQKLTPVRIMQATLRHSIQGILNTLIKQAEWNRQHKQAVAAF